MENITGKYQSFSDFQEALSEVEPWEKDDHQPATSDSHTVILDDSAAMHVDSPLPVSIANVMDSTDEDIPEEFCSPQSHATSGGERDADVTESVDLHDDAPSAHTHETIEKNDSNAVSSSDAIVETTDKDGFPINLFPTFIAKIARELYRTRLFPIGYTLMAILFVISVLVGKSACLLTHLGSTFTNLYVAFVGPKGEDKTRPINWAARPLVELDRDAYASYIREKKEYEEALAIGEKDLVPPAFPRRYIMSNATDEAILKQIGRCPESIGLRRDELMDLLKQSGRYTEKDSDLYLSLFSGASLEIDRATKDEVFFIDAPFVSLIGGIQPDRFIRAFRGDRMDSGLFDRFLLVVRNGYTPKLWKLEGKMETEDIDEKYSSMVRTFLEATEWHGTYELAPDAKTMLQAWQNEKEMELEKNGSDLQIGVFRKIQVYALKFSLLLQILWDVDSDEKNTEHIVSPESAIRATVLADYFFRVSTAMAEEIQPALMSKKEMRLLNELPDVFTAKEGFLKAQENGIGKTSYYEFLGKLNGKVIEKTGRGVYLKKYPGLQNSNKIAS